LGKKVLELLKESKAFIFAAEDRLDCPIEATSRSVGFAYEKEDPETVTEIFGMKTSC